MRLATRSAALLALGLLLVSCGDAGWRTMGRTSAIREPNRRYVRGASITPGETVQIATLHQHLVAEPWIGLGEKLEPLPDTFVTFRPGTVDPDTGRYHYRFEAVLEGEGFRGVLHARTADDGSLRGHIEGSEWDNARSICRPNRRAVCVTDASLSYVGTFVRFAQATTDAGPVLRLTLSRPAGGPLPWGESHWDFQEASAVRKRLAPDPGK